MSFPERFRRGSMELKGAFVGLSCLLCLSSLAEKPSPGLGVNYSSAGAKIVADHAAAQNVALHVPAGESPSPFLPGGKFTATWTGFLSADLRSDFQFQADLNGALKLEVNGVPVLETVGTNSTSALSQPIRLNKGTNLFSATFSSPDSGNAFLRLQWQPKGGFAQPIPHGAFTHVPNAEESAGQILRHGRDLFVEHRCAKCHAGPDSGMPELAMDAPSFDDIGSRRNAEWIARWILNPKEHRAAAQMPKIFGGDSAQANSEAIATYLASLKGNVSNDAPKLALDKSDAGKKLFETLHCAACHNAPDSSDVAASRISLKEAGQKFSPASLADFLKRPDLHYAWIKMPRFKLSDEQRAGLVAYLISNGNKPLASLVSTGPEAAERGKTLLQNSGCLNCHAMKLENKFTAKGLAQISNWKSGCLAEGATGNSKAPQFNFSTEERTALQLFAATDRASLARHVPAEFAERQSRDLNCAECHGKIEGIPQFDILGGKLKPEWAGKFIAGEVDEKPRPWLESQMPAFPKRARLLAEGLAQQHGYPATSVSASPHADLVEVGRNLVSAPPAGFSCISCHTVGNVGATQVFEAPGINLAKSGERLLPGYFKRWLRNPPLVDSMTKMPVYFDDEGKSPLADVLEGSAEKQIDAIWEYLRLGDKMPAPKLD